MKKAIFFIFLAIQNLIQPLYANHDGSQANLLAAEEINRKEIIEQILKNFLKIDEEVLIDEMPGGYSGAELFFVELTDKNFVIRFSNQALLEKREKEIFICKIASEIGYGPKIHFSDPNRGVMVMEYLTNDTQTKDLCVGLANLAKKIHEGPLFPSSLNLFDQINERLDEYLSTDKAQKEFIPKNWLEKIVSALKEIQKAVECHPLNTPCHRDLHKGNLFFSKGQFMAIDFEMAAQDDPFIDLATVSMSYQFNSNEEQLFLDTYFDRKPTIQEESKLSLMKQLIAVFWGVGFINLVGDDDSELLIPLASRETKQIGYRSSKGKLTNAAMLLRNALSNFDSNAYQQAIQILTPSYF